MTTSRLTALLACCALFGGTAIAQEHTLTYSKKVRPVDATVNIAGVVHTMVRLPARDFSTGKKYGIILPAQTIGGFFATGIAITSHASTLLETNATIDGFPAFIQVSDGITFTISSDGLGGNQFLATGQATASINIDLGGTIVTVVNSLSMTDPATGMPPITAAEIGPSANAVPFAKWNKYKDPVDLINALDKWLDFIRIKEI